MSDDEIYISSDNIFADLGFEDPEMELHRADLVLLLERVIADRGLTDAQAAAAMGIDPEALAAIHRRDVGRFSLLDLTTMLTRLDAYDVTITVHPKADPNQPARIAVQV